MLSVAYHEPLAAPPAPPERAAAPLRRIAVTFAAAAPKVAGRRPSKGTPAATLGIPRYSAIIFRNGAAIAR
jgi:hypothetical protein